MARGCTQIRTDPPTSSTRSINTRPSSARSLRDEDLKVEITRVFQANYRVYGAEKLWVQLNREGIGVARCTIERLMRELGLRGAVRGKTRRTTISDPAATRPADLVKRQFRAPAPTGCGWPT